MITIKIIVSIGIILGLFILVPHLRRKFLLWKWSRVIKKIANKSKDPETKKKLYVISDELKEEAKRKDLLIDDENGIDFRD